MTEKCFKKCISKPGSVLDTSEQVNFLFFCFLVKQKNKKQFFFSRNVLPCVWIDLWTRGILFQELMVRDYSEKDPICKLRGFLLI